MTDFHRFRSKIQNFGDESRPLTVFWSHKLCHHWNQHRRNNENSLFHVWLSNCVSKWRTQHPMPCYGSKAVPENAYKCRLSKKKNAYINLPVLSFICTWVGTEAFYDRSINALHPTTFYSAGNLSEGFWALKSTLTVADPKGQLCLSYSLGHFWGLFILENYTSITAGQNASEIITKFDSNKAFYNLAILELQNSKFLFGWSHLLCFGYPWCVFYNFHDDKIKFHIVTCDVLSFKTGIFLSIFYF